MVRHFYQAPTPLSVSRSIFLKKGTKPMTVKSVDTGISSLKTVLFCYRCLTQHLSHFFSQNISQLGTGRPLRPDSQFSTFITKEIGILDCGKMVSLTMRNYVAHLKFIKTEAAHFLKKGWAPRL